MSVQEVVRLDRLAADFCVEVHAAGGEAAGAEKFVERQRQLRHVHGELVGVPAQEVVAAVQVERAEDAQRGGELGRAILAGERSLDDLAAYVEERGLEPQPKSGRQEMLENLANRFS